MSPVLYHYKTEILMFQPKFLHSLDKKSKTNSSSKFSVILGSVSGKAKMSHRNKEKVPVNLVNVECRFILHSIRYFTRHTSYKALRPNPKRPAEASFCCQWFNEKNKINKIKA